MLFCVNGIVHRMGYEEEDFTFPHTGLIEADDADQAKEKYVKHWYNNKEDPNRYYTVVECSVSETTFIK